LKRPLCIHYHIFKNAGTTFDWILERNFRQDALKFDEMTNPDAPLSAEQLLEFLANHDHAKSISSHQLAFSVIEHPEIQFLSIVFLRHPIDRALSICSFMKRDPRDDYRWIKAKSSTLKQFIQFNLESDYKEMRNFQIRFLCRRDNPEHSGMYVHNLYRAYEYLKHFTVFGIVERMDESLVLAEDILRNYFPQMDLSYIMQNVSPDKTGTLSERLEKARVEIGCELMDHLIEANKLDLQLYDHASKKLDELINNDNNFNNKLTDLKKRCLALQYCVNSEPTR
jgi:Sulfotransferase family